jgi:S-adenosylmethionine decarboxylase proenzyme
MQSLIRHLVIELYECPFEPLNDRQRIAGLLVDVAREMKTGVIADLAYHFEPQGVTALLIVSASHLSIHTWPEFGYATFDMVVCMDELDVPRIVEIAQARLSAGRINTIEFRRGMITEHDIAAANSAQ